MDVPVTEIDCHLPYTSGHVRYMKADLQLEILDGYVQLNPFPRIWCYNWLVHAN